VIVKPGGTGTPNFAISARLAPLPPRRFFIVALPSADLPPKKYTILFAISIFLLINSSSHTRKHAELCLITGWVSAQNKVQDNTVFNSLSQGLSNAIMDCGFAKGKADKV
jgi:hypothetical protein